MAKQDKDEVTYPLEWFFSTYEVNPIYREYFIKKYSVESKNEKQWSDIAELENINGLH